MLKIKAYYQLAKPGIIYGNAIAAAAGFFLAAGSAAGSVGEHFFGDTVSTNWPHLIISLIAMLVGLSFVIGGACALNNYYDRDMDAKMERTKSRALVTGSVSPRAALAYGICLLAIGAIVLAIGANLLAMLIALAGALAYVALYTPLKRRTHYSVLIGAVAGAVPPVVGLTAVTGTLAGRTGIEGLVLFLILAFWQMPHFYAIAMYRGDDYAAADIPTLPHQHGAKIAKINILFYMIAFMIATASLTALGFTGYVYLTVVLAIGAVWAWICMKGWHAKTDMENAAWARRVFLFSLVVITVLSVALAVGGVMR